MDQEYIGKLIKEVRKKNGLTQEKFASKYGVTYQAVSKWENGKNIPDISILKEICKDYNIDINDLFKENNPKKKFNKFLVVFILLILVLLLIFAFYLFLNNKSNDFSFRPLSTTCNDFELFGTVAYNSSKTSIHISNITYCGESNNEKYNKIKCTLYENNNNTKIMIDSFSYDGEITLEKFLNKVSFNIEQSSKICKIYSDNALNLEIEAQTLNGKEVFYKIPLKMEDDCN